jgi:monovalent cation:H+ antiporter-2, CPA2 family
VFGAGSLQVGLTMLIVAGAAALAGLDWPAAVFLAGAVAMSSTAIALKQLADQGELNSQHGRIATGIPQFQDLAILPFLTALGLWQQGGEPNAPAVLRAGLGLADQALLLIGFSQDEAGRVVAEVRAELNPELCERVGLWVRGS